MDGRNLRGQTAAGRRFPGLQCAGCGGAWRSPPGTWADRRWPRWTIWSGASGRLELVGTTPNGALAYVDYAHKPEALEKVLEAVRPFTTGRDRRGVRLRRRPRPRQAADHGRDRHRLADRGDVTDDNPRSEDPAAIRAEIMAAAPGATEIGDRREAIRTAVACSSAGDTLIVAGKGHEEGRQSA
jgi:UDP-N-acetylmuramoyl-L-alanyl-D-glutamate--2,6-diaminopimelate ligase